MSGGSYVLVCCILIEDDYEDYIKLSIRQVVDMLGEVLLEKEAVLFTEVYKKFLSIATNISGKCESAIQSTMPKRCLISKLITTFGKHMVCQCKQLSCGLLLYRRGVDLALSLSKILAVLKSFGGSILRSSSKSHTAEFDEDSLKYVCKEMNERIYKESQRIVAEDANQPFDISNFNTEAFIANIDPLIWKMIVLLTQNKGHHSAELSCQYKLKCMYCLCVLMFIRNKQCSPLHLLLTDYIDSQGGSAELVRNLNRVGAVASTDTHHRYVQYQVQKRISEGLTHSLDKRQFTVVSIDNIDFLQSSAFVYCGDQSRSWHGTTVQAVQPIFVPQNSIIQRKRKSPLLHRLSKLTSIVQHTKKQSEERDHFLNMYK